MSGLLSVRSWWIWVLCVYGISLLSLGLFCHGRSSRDPYELPISSGPGEWSISDTVSCLQRRMLGDNFCGLSLRDTDFCVYLKGRSEGRKRIILVDFLLQIQISYLCRYLPPNSFQALHFFFPGTLYLTLNSQSPSWVVNLFPCMYIFIFFKKVSHMPQTSSA